MSISGVTVVLNGNTYNDSSFLSNGHQVAFLNALSDMLVELSSAETNATAAAASAAAAAASASAAADVAVNALSTTSTSSLSIGTGTKSFTLDEDIPIAVGMNVKAVNSADTSEWMFGTVTSYSSGGPTLELNSEKTNGSGTIATWNIFVTGVAGEDGALDLSGLTELDQDALQDADVFPFYDDSASNEKGLTKEQLQDMMYHMASL